MPEKASSGQCSSKDGRKAEEEEEDPVSKSIGDCGRWQIQLIVLLSLFNIPCTWHIYSMTFQASQPEFWCAPPPTFQTLPPEMWINKSHTPSNSHVATFNRCRVWDVDYENMTIDDLIRSDFLHSNASARPCERWEYAEAVPDESVISEWDLVCKRKELAHVAEMSFLVGVAVGGLVSGMVSDRFGRKRTLMASLCLQLVLGISIAFVPLLEVFFVLRALLGFISVGIVFSGFVLCVELVGGKWRTVAGVTYIIPVPISYILIAGIAYYVRPWRDLQLAITLPGLLLLGLWWIVPESPRWLMAVGRVEENLEILKEAARVNRRTLPANMDKLLQQGISGECGERARIVQLFTCPRLRRICLVMFVVWFSVYFIYYGLVMNLSNIGGDIYLNTVISGAVEVPSMAFSIFILLKMGRRWPLSATIFTSGIACLCTLPLGGYSQSVTITLAMMGKLCISCSNAIMPIYTAELYPTVVRNLGVGLSNVSAGIALVLVPYIWNLAEIDERLPMGLLGLIGIIGGLSVLVLEETANRPLKKSFED